MAISDLYTVSTGSVSLASTSQTPVLLIKGSTTSRIWVVGVRVDIGTTAAAAGNNIYFQLCRTNNTPVGTTTANVNGNDAAAPASALFTAYTAWSTAPTVASPPALVWEQQLPQTTGSSWEEFPPLGYEYGVPVNAGSTGWLVMMATASVATSTPVFIDLVISQ